MRIDSLHIENFLGIRLAEANSLGNTVIIAGQNGSGKSAIFEAIKLLKSSSGGYQPGEWQQFFNERQIQLQGRYKNISGIFNDRNKPIKILASISLHPDEKKYIRENIDELIKSTIWQGQNFDAFSLDGFRRQQFLSEQQQLDQNIKDAVDHYRPIAMAELSKSALDISINIDPSENVTTDSAFLVNIAFSNFRPRQIGIIDYHGAQRNYNREALGGINLNLQQAEQNYSQTILYNQNNNKYNNVKSEMAANFVAELLSEHATGQSPTAEGSITTSMKELFATFFPEKEFEGPKATKEGSLKFPVKLPGGGEHDIDDLSSGEKEIVYGYLRMRSSAPRYSIILIDEPELHLNPKLTRKLPEFYRTNLGELLDNQLWLVTHADSLIREAVGKPTFNVFHMLQPANELGNQLRPLLLATELDTAITDLVGDLAAYRPGGRCIIIEGGGDLEFDRRMLLVLFAEELQGVNVICSADKAKVRALHQTLESAYSKGQLPTKFFAISDGDNDPHQVRGLSSFRWDVYHIENYLLDPEMISQTANSITGQDSTTAGSVLTDLKEAAADIIPQLVEHQVREFINRELVGSLALKAETDDQAIWDRLYHAAISSKNKLVGTVEASDFRARVEEVGRASQLRFESSLEDGTWKSVVPGRGIIKKFVDLRKLGQYERFRNVLLSNMANASVKPKGMATIINAIGKS